jgi:formylglycine-generating enzyme required for sulfatase activity
VSTKAAREGDWLSPERVTIPAGTLQLSNGRVLRVDEPFALGRFAVTFDQFDTYCRATGRVLKADEGWGRGTLPVIHVSFDEAMEYAAWLIRMTGRRTRLPTGEEWEYAARAGAVSRYCWGDWIEPGDANYLDTPGFGPLPVASLRPNAWGLYNVLGNVAQWVLDTQVEISILEQPSPDDRAVRGGHWASPAHELDLSMVQFVPLGQGSDRIGFRLVFEA